jgi:hypothetical protein
MAQLAYFVRRLGQRSGRFLSDFPSVVVTLLIYILLTVATYIWMKIQIASPTPNHLFITYELATGADPAQFVTSIQNFRLLWYWVLIFHVVSWLIVPVLAATAVTAAFNVWEERKIGLQQKLIATMVSIIQENTRLSADAADRLAREAASRMASEAKRR